VCNSLPRHRGLEVKIPVQRSIRSTAFGRRQMTDTMAMRMFSREVIFGLFIGLYIGWVNWAA
jgi:type III secretory pathway component EscT